MMQGLVSSYVVIPFVVFFGSLLAVDLSQHRGRLKSLEHEKAFRGFSGSRERVFHLLPGGVIEPATDYDHLIPIDLPRRMQAEATTKPPVRRRQRHKHRHGGRRKKKKNKNSQFEAELASEGLIMVDRLAPEPPTRVYNEQDENPREGSHRKRALEKQVLIHNRTLQILGSSLDSESVGGATRILSGPANDHHGLHHHSHRQHESSARTERINEPERDSSIGADDGVEQPASSWFSLARLAPNVDSNMRGDTAEAFLEGSTFMGSPSVPVWEPYEESSSEEGSGYDDREVSSGMSSGELSDAGSGDGQSQEVMINVEEEDINDPCVKWMRCKGEMLLSRIARLHQLPSCPCVYPSALVYQDKLWDRNQQRYFRWRDINSLSEKITVYKPGAYLCIRSLPTRGAPTLSAQQCCYDRSRQLLTRGSGAGTPNFISPEASLALHERVDLLPWRICRGDFTRYNSVRRPDNGNLCRVNPSNEKYRLQVLKAKDY